MGTKCWLCNGEDIKIVYSNDVKILTPENVRPSDTNYGKSLSRAKCLTCGFVFCPDAIDIETNYVEMIDSEYIINDIARQKQSEEITKCAQKYKNSGTFLDYGAGIGNLVESASNFGFDAFGFEISKSFVEIAKSFNRRVTSKKEEILISNRYDVITLIDVIEHVSNPNILFTEIYNLLKSDGILIVITPNLKSLVAFILRQRWHHYRFAHIGYFSLKTLTQLGVTNNFIKIEKKIPNWHFDPEYIFRRLKKYKLDLLIPILRRVLKNKESIKVNLGDSILIIFKKDK